MLKLTCIMTCEQCDNEIPAWIELESFGGGDEPDIMSMFGAMFGGTPAPANYTIKGKHENIGTWKKVTNGMQFTCSEDCHDKFETAVKEKQARLDDAHNWIRDVKKQKDVSVAGSELPEWFWKEFDSTEENPLCQHDMAIDEPSQYRLRGGSLLSTQGFFQTKSEGFWIWHEPSDTSRVLDLREFSIFGKIVTTSGKIEKGNLAA